MSNRFRNNLFVVVLVFAVLAVVPACRPCPDAPATTECEKEQVTVEEPTFVHNLAVEAHDDKVKNAWKLLKPVTAKRGEGVLFSVDGPTAWILIPDGKIKRVFGGTEWAKAKSFIAFKVENGTAVVMVPRDYPNPEQDIEIHYSVLVQNVSGQWEYVHGENPPPKIIIPNK